MPEIFLILLAGGIMFAAASPSPKSVTRRWLRLAGTLALCSTGLSIFFFYHSPAPRLTSARNDLGITAAIILAYLALARWRPIQRVAALGAFAMALAAAMVFIGRGFPVFVSAAFVAMICGLSLMEMLLGHAYLTTSKMTMAPFRRMNRLLGLELLLSFLISTVGVEWMQYRHPVEMLWMRIGFYAAVRWLVGLIVPLALVYMTGVCIRRRATQSATGILYVICVLTFIGELIGLYLAIETGLPF
jgi:hypothetical protein